MKYVSIFSVTLKSAITPSFIGLMATTFPGVRPSMSLASRPTATTSLVVLLIATMEGSLTTMPLVLANTRVFAVPRSMARSEENRLKTERKLYPFLLIIVIYVCSRAEQRSRLHEAQTMSLLRNHDRHTLNGCATAAILADDYDFVTAARKFLGEVAK